jgi:iron complex outermembrane recepter protein
MTNSIFRRALLSGGAALQVIAVAGAVGAAAPAFAQTTAPKPAAADDEDAQTIVVTGSILRRTNTETASPVTTVTAESLDQRGISTVQDGLQMLASNNGPALTNSFTANGAFAGGASAVSLRGLSTNSTLVLFNGMRAAYYPLADDGTRNFVDLNTIPDDIVDRVEVLRDGASSAYGADAIAGVVNIITKREFKGVNLRGEAGISERGDAGQQRLSATVGTGDLAEKGFNAYLSGFYYKSKALYNRDRPFPYNSSDLRTICFDGTCGPNNTINGLGANGTFPDGGLGQATSILVRPYNAANTANQGRYQLLNGCGNLTPYTLTAAELALPSNGSAARTVCQEDLTNLYGVIAPNINRFGVSGHFVASLGDSTEVHGEVNFLQTKVDYTGNPATIRANAPSGFFYPRYSTSTAIAAYQNTPLTLPIYVCPARVNCTAANGTLNPNNPFAAAGQVARVLGRLSDVRESNATRNRVFRAALGVKGGLFGDWKYDLEATAMHTDLSRTQAGYVYIQHLLDVVADGSYNFVNPSLNSATVRDYLAPTNRANATSDLYQFQAVADSSLAELSGGPLQLAVGTALVYEAVDAPSANSDFNGATQRYFRLNGFASKGHRTTWSAFAELGAPILKQVEVNLSGRYDHYSSGVGAFSPKAGVTFTPFKQLKLRGTYSKGFRIASFGEANATFPTTGYVTVAPASLPCSFRLQHGAVVSATAPGGCTNGNSYITAYSLGETSLSNPDLKPEKSRSFTAGAVFEPISNVSFTVDYYNIKKTQAITVLNFSPAIDAYYAGLPTPAGYQVVADAPDINNPAALPRLAFVQAPFANANSQKSEGVDFSMNSRFTVGGVKWYSNAEASYIIELSTTFPDGSKETYAGTLGNFNLTAGSGTPRWHGYWQNRFDFGGFALGATANYFGGYDLSAEDQTGSGTAGKCGLSDGFTPCRVKAYTTFDLNGTVKVNDQFTLFLNVLNVLDKLPPIDPVTYGAHNYNPVQGGNGILGRYYKVGIRANF